MYLKSFIISENQKITPLFKCAKSDYKYQWALENVHFDIGQDVGYLKAVYSKV